MRYVSLFSGIEAASVAWGPLGWEPMAFAEVDPFCRELLRERFPEVPNLGDVTAIDWGGFIGESCVPDVVVGGSPCQSFSVAGNREGLAGASGLMWEYVRAVRELVPRWVVWENVPGALSSSNGEDFRCLLDSLDELGYGLAWRVLDAQFFGVAQRRRRVFLVGHFGDVRAADVLFEPESLRWDHQTGREKRQELAARAGDGAEVYCINGNVVGRAPENGGHHLGASRDGMAPTLTTADRHAVAFVQNQRGEVRAFGGDGDSVGALAAQPGMKQQCFDAYGMEDSSSVDAALEVAPTLRAHNSGGQCGMVAGFAAAASPSAGSVSFERGTAPTLLAARNDASLLHVADGRRIVRRLTPLECERLQGFPDGWTAIDVGGKPAPDTPRYRALGNSMAVPVMRWIGERIVLVASRVELERAM